MSKDIEAYNDSLPEKDRDICHILSQEIDNILAKAEKKIWHGNPVWFLDENPIVGYSKLKNAVQLLFWSGQSFDEPLLQNTGNHKAAGISYTAANEINKPDLKRWLEKSQQIQWDYKNIVKRKGVLERLK